ncbi:MULTISPECIES: hypothetical protein [Flavobacteriaceae]|uniref:hypothetical protein n=1 Tax=Flavobacteriaceae TaxID=49546 RepID=UPI00234B818B|nr:hypothetical protein [Muricauda sp. SP22]MDC6363813.1 hypothetical protein [Muricauda sp. SP22]
MIKYWYTLVVFSLMIPQTQAQSGWTRKAKSFYVQSSVSHYSSKDYYTTEGNLSDSGSRFNSSALFLYGEYGITDRITAIVDFPVIMLNSFSSTETVAGVGSVKVGLKYKVFNNIPIAVQADFEIPTDDGTNFARSKRPNALGTFDEINLPTSDGEFNVWTNIIGSHSFGDGKTYGSLYTGINFRTESFSNQFQAGAEVGHLFFDKLYLIGKLRILEKLSSGDGFQGGSFLYGEGTTFTSYGFNAIYKLGGHLSLVSSYSDYAGFLVERKNIYDGATFSLGISIEY